MVGSLECVVKFGGSSVVDIERVLSVISSESPDYVVVSAPGRVGGNEKVTDMLIGLTQESENEGENGNGKGVVGVLGKFFGKKKGNVGSIVGVFDGLFGESANIVEEELKSSLEGGSFDFIVSRGEYLTAKLLAERLDGYSFVDAMDVLRYDEKTDSWIVDRKNLPKKSVIPGFYGNKDGEVKLFSRGGSDLSAALIADRLNLPFYKFTDTAVKAVNPNLLKNSHYVKELTFNELRHLTFYGFSIVHSDVWGIMERSKNKIYVEDLNEGNITKVSQYRKIDEKNFLACIEVVKDITLLNVYSNKNYNLGFESEVTSLFAEKDLNIITSSGGVTGTSYLLKQDKSLESKLVELRKSLEVKGYEVNRDKDLCLISFVGEGLKEREYNKKVLTEISNGEGKIYTINKGENSIDFVLTVDESFVENNLERFYNNLMKI